MPASEHKCLSVSFSAPSYVEQNTGCNSVAAADIDGDSVPDALCSNTNSNLDLMWYRGDDWNCPYSTCVVRTDGPDWRSIDAADVDGDGNVDILTGDSGASLGAAVRWFENAPGDDGPSFTEAVIDSSSTDDYYYSVTAVDIDGDSHMDVLCDKFYSGILKCINDGSQSFTCSVIVSGTINPAANVVHIDGDGDVVYFREYSSSSSNDGIWYYDSSAGTSDQLVVIAGATIEEELQLAVADLDGDGLFDVVSGHQSNGNDEIAWAKNNNDTSFTLDQISSPAYRVKSLGVRWPRDKSIFEWDEPAR